MNMNLTVSTAGDPVPPESQTPYPDATLPLTASAKVVTDEGMAPVSAVTAGMAPLDSPDFTDTPTAPTAAPGTNTDQLATTAFAQGVKSEVVGGAPAGLDTLSELAAAINNDPNFHESINARLMEKEDSLVDGALAALAHSKVAVNVVPVLDSSGMLVPSGVTDAELGSLSGVTGNVETRLDALEAGGGAGGDAALAFQPPVGTLQYMSDAGTLIVFPDGAEWLRSGTVASAASYPAAATCGHLRVIGNPAAGWPDNATCSQVAENGAGTIVACYDNANVAVSTDWGRTWTTVPANLDGGCLASGVCWNGTVFIVVGRVTTTLYFATSTDGLIFAASHTNTTNVDNYSGSDARILWNGSIAVVALVQSTADYIHTTIDGTSANAVLLGAGGVINGFQLAGAERFVVNTNVNSGPVTTAKNCHSVDGTVWTVNSIPVVSSKYSGGIIGISDSSWLFFPLEWTTKPYLTTDTGTTHDLVTLPIRGYIASADITGGQIHQMSGIIGPAQTPRLYRTLDGESWSLIQTRAPVVAATPSGRVYFGSDKQAYWSDYGFDGPGAEFVGVSMLYASGADGTFVNPTLYARVK